ncbi:cell surface glycoprotein CD200 receptor 1-like [Talpa occidentalis]|uniref:cell surface glycoprotein CD200 receptor 1-like n=1 Tax=Talpa occidentalis TaxID=50954 RepID=UPI00188F1613|nr:cell surface glycoprotein CD200 receptor 1-like [Talpa occidentalis]
MSTLKLLISFIIVVSGNNTSLVTEIKNQQMPPIDIYSFLPVQVDTKVVLSCPPVQSNLMWVVTWRIALRDKLLCTITHRTDTNKTVEGKCTDQRITWASRPDQNPALQIDPLSITHDGNYTCELTTHVGNFYRGYSLQVLVAPDVTLFQTEARTAVCQAAAGKPAAQISWTPEGDCVTEKKRWDNGTVTVQSMCRWAERNVSAVSCSVSHFTGSNSLSIELSEEHENKKSLKDNLDLMRYHKKAASLQNQSSSSTSSSTALVAL